VLQHLRWRCDQQSEIHQGWNSHFWHNMSHHTYF